MHLTTDRLVLSDVEKSDLDALVAVARSNPDFTTAHEGSDGVPGHFDLDMLERDLAVASLDPGRHPLALRTRASGDVVGWAEVLDQHPVDGLPWVGLLEIRADVQGRGYGTEAGTALVEWARQHAASALRLGVDDDNLEALAFWRGLGFTAVERRERPSPQGPTAVTVLERAV